MPRDQKPSSAFTKTSRHDPLGSPTAKSSKQKQPPITAMISKDTHEKEGKQQTESAAEPTKVVDSNTTENTTANEPRTISGMVSGAFQKIRQRLTPSPTGSMEVETEEPVNATGKEDASASTAEAKKDAGQYSAVCRRGERAPTGAHPYFSTE
eukprot:TRINITY_DN63575_c0_g1_i1.p2 TRINITY_DN63575_c0_g1~~TRINITY_DN63575_c0_g1_i1.p2  ORF type:complete len:153 (+),score=8.02 TRINITY_DN63575_c0_g1_i1:83-541(+)